MASGLFSGVLTQSVTIEPFVAEAASGWGGAAEYGSGVAHQCRIELRQKRVTGSDGRELVSMGRIVLAGLWDIDTRSRITLPTGYTPTQPAILAVEQSPDPFGVAANTVIWFGVTR